MIHIATVHHLSDKWIDIQLKYFDKYIKTPYRVYAFLNGIEKDHSSKFYSSSKDDIESHAQKLNILAEKIVESADDDDLIMFLDGDAFPIHAIDTFLNEKLEKHNLIAIKRDVDFGECHPHPCFCVTKVSFWKAIKGDWETGYVYENQITKKHITTVGCNLLKTLIDKNISWYSLKRSNVINMHPQWFGLYDNIIYHHGAGFRESFSKVDRHRIESPLGRIGVILIKIIFGKRFLHKKTIIKNNKLSSTIYNSILSDSKFYDKL